MNASLYCSPCAKHFALEAHEDGKSPCPDCGEMLEAPATRDVFISYAREDLEHAQQVASLLGAAGIGHWVDVERIKLGGHFLEHISEGLEEAKAVVLILSSRAITSPWVDAEISDAKSNGLPILPLKIEEFELPRRWRLALAHHQWLDVPGNSLSTQAECIVDQVRTVLLNDAARLPADSAAVAAPAPVTPVTRQGVDPDRPPYIGPRHFVRGMTARFFGRQKEAEALLRQIARSRILLVFAASGAGKSSLLNTVVHDSLEDQGLDVCLDARVGGALPRDVKEEEIRNIFTFSALYGLERSAAPDPTWRLGDYLSSIARKRGTVGRVLVFDQFEEIFTQHRERFEDRAAFFEEVAEALGDDPSLRVVFALRQEYLADVDPLIARLAEDYATETFHLQRIGFEGALEAVKKPAEPHAQFAPGVAERIVEQLNTIKVKRSDGTVIEKSGEFIETVHLQIVCRRMWSRLPPGTKTIDMSHLESAADGADISAFVANALDAFYEETIESVANSAITREHGSFSKESIQLGCMKFVTPSATRTMVQRANGRTGRLPDWIVEQLERSHLLRVEQRGGELWYELSHDRLAEPVGRQLNREVSTLLFASDLLNKVLENVLQGREDGLRGYFGEHREVLKECSPFHGQELLFPDEAEFLFRAALASGDDLREWSRRLEQDSPDARVDVLADALSSESAAVRRNAATLLGDEPAERLSERLIDLALDDPEPEVERAAAASLARLDRPPLFDALFAALQDPARRPAATRAAGRMLVAAERLEASSLERCLRQLTRRERARIRQCARRERLRRGLPAFAFLVLPAALFASLTAPLFKWLPGAFNWALGQATPSAAMGVFHGVIAGVLWAGFITFGVTFYNVVLDKPRAPKSAVRPVGALLAGAVSGFIGSALIVATIIGVYNVDSLMVMGWVSTDADRLRAAFLETRFGWVYLITGTGLGVGMALAMNALRVSSRWQRLLDADLDGKSGFEQLAGTARKMLGIVLPHAWLLPAAVALAAVAAFFVPALPADPVIVTETGAMIATKATARDLVQALIGDCLTQVIGAYFGICGMGVGAVVMRHGLRVEPRTGYA